jgi:hypothetical protein
MAALKWRSSKLLCKHESLCKAAILSNPDFIYSHDTAKEACLYYACVNNPELLIASFLIAMPYKFNNLIYKMINNNLIIAK